MKAFSFLSRIAECVCPGDSLTSAGGLAFLRKDFTSLSFCSASSACSSCLKIVGVAAGSSNSANASATYSPHASSIHSSKSSSSSVSSGALGRLERPSGGKLLPGTCFSVNENNRIAAIQRLMVAEGCKSGLLSIPLMYFASTSTTRFLTAYKCNRTARIALNSPNSSIFACEYRACTSFQLIDPKRLTLLLPSSCSCPKIQPTPITDESTCKITARSDS